MHPDDELGLMVRIAAALIEKGIVSLAPVSQH